MAVCHSQDEPQRVAVGLGKGFVTDRENRGTIPTHSFPKAIVGLRRADTSAPDWNKDVSFTAPLSAKAVLSLKFGIADHETVSTNYEYD